ARRVAALLAELARVALRIRRASDLEPLVGRNDDAPRGDADVADLHDDALTIGDRRAVPELVDGSELQCVETRAQRSAVDFPVPGDAPRQRVPVRRPEDLAALQIEQDVRG